MNKKVFSQIINKPCRFKFKNFKNNFKFNNGLGTEIISTVKGVNTSNKLGRLNLGGQKIIQLY
jgi:ribosomal protein S8